MKRHPCVVAGLVLVAAGATTAAPVSTGGYDGNSYTVNWQDANPDGFGVYSTFVIEFISEQNTGDLSTQSNFESVSFGGGWNAAGHSGTLYRADGSVGTTAYFNLTHYATGGAGSTLVTYIMWQYNNGVALGGWEGTGLLSNPNGFAWTQRNGGDAPLLSSIPLPSGSALAGLGLIGLGSRRRRIDL